MKNKGFTLIELLAVIVILAIIALITVPVVINIINNAKKGAAEDSTYGVIESAKLYWTSNQSTSLGADSNITFTCNESGVCSSNGSVLEMTGTKPTGGKVKIINGVVSVENLKFGEYYCNSNDNGKVTCSKEGSSEGNDQYVYSTSISGYNPSDPSTISDTKPTDRDTYLRYELTDGELLESTMPEVCYYNENHGGELCLKHNEFNVTMQKVKEYFEYNENPSNCSAVEDDYIYCTYIFNGFVEVMVSDYYGYATINGSGELGCMVREFEGTTTTK